LSFNAIGQKVNIGTVTVATVRASSSRFGFPDPVASVIVCLTSQTRDYESFVQSNQFGQALALLPPDRYCLKAFDVRHEPIPMQSKDPVCITLRDGQSPQIQLVLAALPANPTAQVYALPPYEDAEAYEVYAAVLPNIAAMRTLSNPLIQQETQSRECDIPGEYGEQYRAVFGSALENYREVNRKRWLLQLNLKLDRPYELVSEADLHQYYPRSHHIVVSAVGFNSTRTAAVVYVADSCPGGLCSSGEVCVVEKKDGRWEPKKNWGLCGWISFDGAPHLPAFGRWG
jgi:hypothetical protein